jgi:hypothetical protein
VIDEDIRRNIEPELEAGEKLLWVGKPIKSFDLKALYILGSLSFLFILLLVFLFESHISPFSSNNVPHYVYIVVLGIAALGSIRHVYIGREYYGFSDSSVLIVSGLPIPAVHKVSLGDILKCRVKNGGLNLTLKGNSAFKARTASYGFSIGNYYRSVVALKYLSDPQTPHELLNKLIKDVVYD